MKTYTCIIIDDEQYAVDALSTYVDALPNIVLVKAYLNPLEALTELSVGDGVDLVLMDINMPLISGIDLSIKIRTKTKKLVFTTSHSQYGYQAFEAGADGYLLKPYTLSKFAVTIGKLFPPGPSILTEQFSDNFFFAKNKSDHHKLVKINIDEIIAVESKQNYVLIHMRDSNVLTHMSLTEISKILKEYFGFCQFHRSFIINVRHIDYIYGNTIKMLGGLEMTIGDHYRKAFSLFLNAKILKGRI